VSCVSFSSTGKYIAVGERGKQPSLRVFDLKTGAEIANLQKHTYGVKDAVFSPDDRLVASIGYEFVIRCFCEASLLKHSKTRLCVWLVVTDTTGASMCGSGAPRSGLQRLR